MSRHPPPAPPPSGRSLHSLAWSLVIPALRWDGSAYGPDSAAWISSGASGLILFGGTARAAHDHLREIRAVAARPILVGADLERGAGQQFAGATSLPPAAALGELDDPGITRSAAAMTAREAAAIGVDTIFAPVADIASEADNPIVGPRAFSSDRDRVSRHVAAWVSGCLSAGGRACPKHFPGHGGTTGDSHVGPVALTADRASVEADWAPFRAAIEAGATMVMTAHVAVPAIDPSGRPATRSRPILQNGLREGLGFDGLIVTDALLMAGAGSEAEAAVEAVVAGVDLLLYPNDPGVAVEALVRAAEGSDQVSAALERSAGRVAAALGGTRRPSTARGGAGGGDAGADDGWGRPADERLAADWARRSIRAPRGRATAEDPVIPPGAAVHLVEVDDDLGGPYPAPDRDPFRRALAGRVRLTASGEADRVVVAVYADTRGWKGRAGLSSESAARVRTALDGAGDRSVEVVVFGGERPAADLPAGRPCWLAWGGEARMQRAAAERVTGAGKGSPSGGGRAG